MIILLLRENGMFVFPHNNHNCLWWYVAQDAGQGILKKVTREVQADVNYNYISCLVSVTPTI